MADETRPSTPDADAGAHADTHTDSGAADSAGVVATRNVVTELVGTTIVMLLGPGLIVLGGVGDVVAAIGFGAGAAIAIGVIGAVANPAFTLALFVVREISAREAIGDWIGQVLGGVLGGAVIWGINDLDRVAAGANGWERDGFAELGSVIAAEFVFAIVVVVALLACIAQGLTRQTVAAFTGLAVLASQLALVPMDGGGLNPARSLGSAIFSDADPSPLGQLWVFVLVPLGAAVAAVFVWLAIDDAELDDTRFDDTFLDDAQNVLTGDDG